MSLVTAAGTILRIGTTAADAATDTFQVVGEITDMGEFGRVYELITHQSLDTRKTRKFKGSYNDGSFTLSLGRDLSDAGQTALDAAVDDDGSFNVQIELNDSAGVNGTTFDFKCKVMSFTTQVGTPNSLVGAAVQMEVDGDITRTAAG